MLPQKQYERRCPEWKISIKEAGNDPGSGESSGFMGNDKPKMGYRREQIPPVENVLSRKTLLLSCSKRENKCGRGTIYKYTVLKAKCMTDNQGFRF